MSNRLAMRACIPPDVLLQEIRGESVLLNLSSGRYFGLNAVGTRMWQVCTSAASLQDALNQLVAEYEVDPKRLEQELQELVDQLVEHGLLAIRE